MNVDEFLEQVAKSKEIPLPESEAVPEKKVNAVDSSSSVVSDEKAKKLFIDSPAVPTEKAKKSFVDFVRTLIVRAEKSIQSNDLGNARRAISELIRVSQSVPAPAIKIKLNKEILRLQNMTKSQAPSFKNEFVASSELINDLVSQAMEHLSKKDFLVAEKYLDQAQAKYHLLSDEFAELKHDLLLSLMELQSKLVRAKKGSINDQFYRGRDRLMGIISDAQIYLSQKNYNRAFELYSKANTLYRQLPEGFFEEKLRLHESLVKTKTALDLLTHISNLNSELVRSGIQVPKVISSETDYLEKHATRLQQKAQDLFPKKEENSVSMDAKVKQATLGQIKLDLLNENYARARDSMEKLRDQFPNDDEIADLHAHLHGRLSLLSGKSPVSKSGSRMSAPIQTSEELFLESKIFESLRNKMERKQLATSSIAIARRLQLAIKQIRRGSLENARVNLKRILELDPNHQEAARLYNMIR